MPQAPGYQATTQQTPRVLTRGQLEYFIFSFFYDEAQTQPVVPYDPATYPSFSVSSPQGELLSQGVAVPAGQPGAWKIGWVVPLTAALTTAAARYRFQAVMVDTNLRQFEISFEFDVVESAVPAQHPENQQYLTFIGEPIRLKFVSTVRPDFLQVKVTRRQFASGTQQYGFPYVTNAALANAMTLANQNSMLPAGTATPTNVLHVASLVTPQPATPTGTELHEVVMGNHYVYYTDTPPFAYGGDYAALWSVRDTPVSQTDLEHQIIEVVTDDHMYLVKSLRMVVDRLQKKVGIVFAYTNESLIEYVKQGVSLLNGYTPPTSYTVTNLPSALESFAILAAAWYTLQAQRVLYAETNLSFSGQTGTLDYNPGADIDGVMQAMKDTLDNQLRATKKNLFRQAMGVGSVATRPLNFRHNLVYKTSAGRGMDLINRLAEFGLLD